MQHVTDSHSMSQYQVLLLFIAQLHMCDDQTHSPTRHDSRRLDCLIEGESSTVMSLLQGMSSVQAMSVQVYSNEPVFGVQFTVEDAARPLKDLTISRP